MKITNKFGLPETIVNALNKPTYSKGGAHASATELLSSPRMVQLRIKHADEIEMDASEMVWSLVGTAMHGVLEHGKGDDHIVEQRLTTEIDGWTVSGAIDLQTVKENSISISDYKTCGVYAVMNEKAEWEQQLNIYAWLVQRVKKSVVDGIEIVAFIRDWKRRDVGIKRDYPDAPVKVIPIRIWDYEYAENFVRNRIHLHAEAMFSAQTGGDLPLCSSEDTWERPTMYAVKKVGGARATKVFVKRADAEAYLAELGDKYELEVREGERTRCEHYCNVSQFCSQYKDYQMGK